MNVVKQQENASRPALANIQLNIPMPDNATTSSSSSPSKPTADCTNPFSILSNTNNNNPFSPCKGPKIAWKKQYKRRAASTSPQDPPTLSQASEKQQQAPQQVIIPQLPATTLPTPLASEEQAKASMVLESPRSSNSTIQQPNTPPQNSRKRKIISPLTESCTNTTAVAREQDNKLTFRQITFSASPRENKLARRMVLNKVTEKTEVKTYPDQVKPVLKFVF